MTWPELDGPADLAAKLTEVGYLPSADLVQAAYLALRLRRPLFLEGDPGVGKTDLARKIAEALGAECIRLQCHAGMDTSQVLYDWNFPRQILALRAGGDGGDREAVLRGLYTQEFFQPRPILQALEGGPAVLLIDEVDRADDEFEALLLEVLEEYSVVIPGFRTVTAEVPPLVVLTSNQTREVHDALKRRCLYHRIDHPDAVLEERILMRRVPGLADGLAYQIASALQRIRADKAVTKPPGVAETIDFATALAVEGATELESSTVDAAISTLAKRADDVGAIRRLLLVPVPRESP